MVSASRTAGLLCIRKREEGKERDRERERARARERKRKREILWRCPRTRGSNYVFLKLCDDKFLALDDFAANRQRATSPQSGIKSSFSTALIRNARRRIPASASSNFGTEKGEGGQAGLVILSVLVEGGPESFPREI